MNIVKFKDIILTEENAPELTQKQRDIFNENFKGKYAYCVNWQYCVPLENMSQSQYVELSKELCEKISYKIKWYCEDELLETDYVDYNVMPEYHSEVPTKESTPQYEYNFVGWDKEIVPAVEDTEYHAVFDEILRQYTIQFINHDDVLQSELLYYGDIPEYHGETPSMPSSEHYDYVFDGWDNPIEIVTGDREYRAIFNSIPKKYTIIWKGYDDSIIREDKDISYGSYTPEPPIAPDVEGMQFIGWDPEISEIVLGETEYHAIYEPEPEPRNIYRVVKSSEDIDETKDFIFVGFNGNNVITTNSVLNTGGYIEAQNVELEDISKEEFDAYGHDEAVQYKIKLIPTETENTYYIYLVEGGYYIGKRSTKENKVIYSTNFDDIQNNNGYKWTISIEEGTEDNKQYDAVITNYGYNTYSIKYNDSQYARFSVYTSGQKPISIFYNVQNNRKLFRGFMNSSSNIPKIVSVSKINYDGFIEPDNENQQIVNER